MRERVNTVLAKFNTVLTKKNTDEFSVIFSYSVDSSLGRVPATITLGVALTDETLLFLAWPPSAARSDAAVVLAVTTFTAWAWATRSSPEVLAPHILQARVSAAARGGHLFSIL